MNAFYFERLPPVVWYCFFSSFLPFFEWTFHSFHMAGYLFSTKTLYFGQYPINICCTTREINVVSLNFFFSFCLMGAYVRVYWILGVFFFKRNFLHGPYLMRKHPKMLDGWLETFLEFELTFDVIKTNNDFSGRIDRNKAIEFYLRDFFSFVYF